MTERVDYWEVKILLKILEFYLVFWQQPCGFYLHLMIFLGLWTCYITLLIFLWKIRSKKCIITNHRLSKEEIRLWYITCLYDRCPLNPAARALTVCDIYSFAVDYYFLYVLCMKDIRIWEIPECLKCVQRDVSNIVIL